MKAVIDKVSSFSNCGLESQVSYREKELWGRDYWKGLKSWIMMQHSGKKKNILKHHSLKAACVWKG